MIIRYTFNDNDYTQIIEKYIEEFGPFARWVPNSNVDKIIELKTQYDNYNDKYMSQERDITKGQYINLKKRLTIELYKHFKAYINNIQENSNWSTSGFDAKHLIESKDYILKNIKIKLVRNIPDQWENGEVTYFYHMKYLTM